MQGQRSSKEGTRKSKDIEVSHSFRFQALWKLTSPAMLKNMRLCCICSPTSTAPPLRSSIFLAHFSVESFNRRPS